MGLNITQVIFDESCRVRLANSQEDGAVIVKAVVAAWRLDVRTRKKLLDFVMAAP